MQLQWFQKSVWSVGFGYSGFRFSLELDSSVVGSDLDFDTFGILFFLVFGITVNLFGLLAVQNFDSSSIFHVGFMVFYVLFPSFWYKIVYCIEFLIVKKCRCDKGQCNRHDISGCVVYYLPKQISLNLCGLIPQIKLHLGLILSEDIGRAWISPTRTLIPCQHFHFGCINWLRDRGSMLILRLSLIELECPYLDSETISSRTMIAILYTLWHTPLWHALMGGILSWPQHIHSRLIQFPNRFVRFCN